MNLALTAFTRRGAGLARRLAGVLTGDGHACTLAFPERLAGELAWDKSYAAVGGWAAEQFARADALIFVGASGIAVRAIAPWVKDKLTDPAVVSVDEGGAFAVPLLSGHVGGANDLARRVAAITGGTAAISTATDVNSLFAVDEWAARQGLVIGARTLAKEVSAALLEGKTVGFASDFPVEGALPAGLTGGAAPLGVHITAQAEKRPFPRTLSLFPPCLTLGIGCRRGTAEEDIAAAADSALAAAGYDRRAVCQVATIDLKADEPGLLAFCARMGVPMVPFSAEELSRAEGEFTPSAFVRSVTGVDNVCERAAVLAGGTLVVPKRAGGGVTAALALRAPKLSFEGERHE